MTSVSPQLSVSAIVGTYVRCWLFIYEVREDKDFTVKTPHNITQESSGGSLCLCVNKCYYSRVISRETIKRKKEQNMEVGRKCGRGVLFTDVDSGRESETKTFFGLILVIL